MATPLNTIKNWFKTGLKPTQTQFWSMFDSFWHKAEQIPTSSINGLDGTLDNKVDKASYDIEQQEVADALVTIGEDVTGKVDKVDGKGLSTNDFTDAYKGQLDNPPVSYIRGRDYSSNGTVIGVIDGVNTIFDTSSNFVSGSTEVDLNIPQSIGFDYDETGVNEITFVNPPEIGDNIIISYEKQL